MVAGHRERLTEAARAAAEQPWMAEAAARSPSSPALFVFDGPHQHRVRDALRPTHHVEAPVDAVRANYACPRRRTSSRCVRYALRYPCAAGSSWSYASTSTIGPPTPSTSSLAPISSRRDLVQGDD